MADEFKGTSLEKFYAEETGEKRLASSLFSQRFILKIFRGVRDYVIESPFINKDSHIVGSISEWNSLTQRPFMGAAGLAIYNIAPHTGNPVDRGFVMVKINNTWPDEFLICQLTLFVSNP